MLETWPPESLTLPSHTVGSRSPTPSRTRKVVVSGMAICFCCESSGYKQAPPATNKSGVHFNRIDFDDMVSLPRAFLINIHQSCAEIILASYLNGTGGIGICKGALN